MNLIALIIIIALATEYLLQSIAAVLNLRALRKPVPEEFRGSLDESEAEKSRAYTRANTRVSIASSAFFFVLLLLFWFAGGFNLLDQWVRSLGWGEILTGLIYIGILMLARMVLALPFSIWSTFVVEEKFGFNRTTPTTFLADRLKGLLVTIAIGGPLLAAILAFFTWGGDLAWLWAWIGVTLFMLAVQFIAPAWIMPLFNEFKPLEDESLRKKIHDYAESVGFPFQGVWVMDGSRRSGKSNAFFTGFGKNKRIALFDTLVEQHEERELLAIVAHEVGHYKLRHIPKNSILSILQTGVLFALLQFFLLEPALYNAFFMEEISIYAGLLFFGLLYSPVELILSVGMQALSRKYEFEADAFAASTTEDPEGMVQALKKLSKDNLSNLNPHPLHVFLNYSHPPVLERIEAIRAVAPARG
ncbi:MAG: M48 family metallopeptidase [Balneolaceae bacterium]